MALSSKRGWAIAAVMAVAIVGANVLRAAEAKRPTKVGAYKQGEREVELFQAIKDGQVEVKFIPKDSTEARVMISNRSGQPLNVQLPDAFAAVHVLAQFGGGAGGGMGGMGGGGGGGQSMGGGMGGGGMGGGGGGGGNFFNVPADRVGELRVTTVCLEHGKPDPSPTKHYEIRPIETVTDRPAVQELCKMLGRGEVSQRMAQAAAWNLNNDMSWEELAAKAIKRLNGNSYPYFNPQELRGGFAAAHAASEASKQRTVEGQTVETTAPEFDANRLPKKPAAR